MSCTKAQALRHAMRESWTPPKEDELRQARNGCSISSINSQRASLKRFGLSASSHAGDRAGERPNPPREPLLPLSPPAAAGERRRTKPARCRRRWYSSTRRWRFSCTGQGRLAAVLLGVDLGRWRWLAMEVASCRR
jgi:hypothetical protein